MNEANLEVKGITMISGIQLSDVSIQKLKQRNMGEEDINAFSNLRGFSAVNKSNHRQVGTFLVELW